MPDSADVLRARILELSGGYFRAKFGERTFTPGETPVPVSGKVLDEADLANLIDASLDLWLTTGRFADRFERAFAKRTGARHALLVNSGSSANLLALSCLTSPQLKDRRLRPGDEVITVASGFPTTVNPVLQNGLVPVFVDVQIPTYNIDVSQLEAARSERTRAVMIAHTLGNPFDLAAVKAFCEKYELYLIEDCCDALGAKFDGQGVGTFGHLATASFYPAHHITMGEGGCVMTSDPQLKKLVESFRDWGRDCWCAPGVDNTCGKRFHWQLGDLPQGFDHKYTYSHIGYNLKLTDMQAAIGLSQLDKLDGFIAARNANFATMREGLRDLTEFFILPEATPGGKPSWFGFPIAVREDAPFTRNEIVAFLEANRIGTRLLFGGNLVRQPAYREANFRTVGELKNADFVMNQVFWTGVFPGLSPAHLEYALEMFHAGAKTLAGRSQS